MLTYNEHQLPFLIGECSLNTTSFGFSGLNLKWVSLWPLSSSSTCQPVKPPVKSVVVRPSDLDDEMITINNIPLSFKAKNNSHLIVPQPKKVPTISYIEDSEIEIDAGPINIPVPSIQVNERYDEEEGDEGIFKMANAKHDFVLSSPVKRKADIVNISVDLLINLLLTPFVSAG